jgi:hypothetical protein
LLDVARIHVSPDPDYPQWVTPPAGLQRLATTVETWWPEILAFLHTGSTTAGSEGTNRLIKTVARDAYGFRNPVNQRLRTRCATTRRARGHLDAANFVEPAPVIVLASGTELSVPLVSAWL